MKQRFKQNKGITLANLVLTIILLFILAGISVYTLFGNYGVITRAEEAKQIQDVATAQEKLELLKATIIVDKYGVKIDDYLAELEKVKKEYGVNNVERINNTNAEVLISEKYKFLLLDEENGNVKIIYEGETGGLELSKTSGTYTYPISGTFEVVKNESGGELLVETENENIAKASINGTTVTVEPQTMSGEVKIIVKSAANGKYASGKAIYTAIVENGTLTVTATPYSGTYDGQAHGINVTCAQTGAKITYATSAEGPYTDTKPIYTDASTHTTYYKVELEGYTTESGSLTVTIGQANGDLVLSKTSGTITYPTAGTFEVTRNVSGGTLSVTSSNTAVATVSVSGTTVTVVPGTTEGTATITVKSAATTNYKEITTTFVATVQNGTLDITATPYSGTYDGQAHGINVTCAQTGAKITYATSAEGPYTDTKPIYTDASTHTTYYKVELEGYTTESGSLTVTIGQANGDLVLSKTSGTITYPTAGTFEVTRNVSGGTLSVTSSNTAVATVSVSGTTVTVVPGTTEGTATITVKSAATTNYKEITTTFVATVQNGTLDITATPYSGTYDGQAHGINVTCAQTGAKITYATSAEGPYTDTKPIYTDASTHTTYYKVELEGYTTESGSLTVTIGQANGDLVLSKTSGTITYPTAGTFEVTRNVSGGTLSVTSSNTAVATASVSGTTVTVVPGTTEGTATITVKSAATTNYKEITTTFVATVQNGTLDITATPYSGTYDGQAHGINVTCTQTGAKITYATSADGTYSTTKPTYTDVGTYTTYYKVELSGYETVSGSLTVTINKQLITGISLSSTSTTLVGGNIPTSLNITATISPTNAANKQLQWSSSDSSIATVDNNGVVTAGNNKGEVTITAAAMDGSGIKGSIVLNTNKLIQYIVKDGKLLESDIFGKPQIIYETYTRGGDLGGYVISEEENINLLCCLLNGSVDEVNLMKSKAKVTEMDGFLNIHNSLNGVQNGVGLAFEKVEKNIDGNLILEYELENESSTDVWTFALTLNKKYDRFENVDNGCYYGNEKLIYQRTKVVDGRLANYDTYEYPISITLDNQPVLVVCAPYSSNSSNTFAGVNVKNYYIEY